MARKKNRHKNNNRLIPPQNKKICFSICVCQMGMVISCVAFIYLCVAIYIPAYRAFNSGYLERPVMCQTINTSIQNNCSWASCGEWCLTKTSGFCPQIHVTTRQNGTTVQFQECVNFTSIACPAVNHAALKRYNCNNGSECSSIRGVFNCSMGHCTNMSQVYHCHHKADGPVLDSDKDNVKLNGFFECQDSKCIKIKKPFNCDRYCPLISTFSTNLLITSDDNLYTALCKRGIAFTEANGKEEGKEIEPTVFWEGWPGDNVVLMTSCHTVTPAERNSINATDCINGTFYDADVISNQTMNFTTLWAMSMKWRDVVDHKQKFLPMQHNLTIYNDSHLYINLEGCVNTLKGECKQFYGTHGRDGRNQTAQSRFPCYYNKNSSAVVLARYDLNRTWNEFVIAITIPSVFFVVSFMVLCVIVHVVNVGDDTRMRCMNCLRRRHEGACEMTTRRYLYDEEVSSPIEGLIRRDVTSVNRD